ncbi:MAG: hypothetical protein WCY15_10250 [Phenylobacterium sp.]|jgi:hypothetical protein|uniref:hypothetical protein n=1 Tax=Phenylobacterium sp. TaxID=1871053 RepID=UPI002A36F65E|nr:hypothetical protein [Phenylobacterium sp.]MDX9996321.1 hypothetical protein [Phenylobacterium sp.]
MRRSCLIILSSLLTTSAAAAADSPQDSCAALSQDIAAIEERLASSRAGAARGFLAGLASSALGATPYVTISDNPLAQAVADNVQGTVRDTATDVVRGDIQAPTGDAKADRKRLKSLQRDARAKGCA